MRTTIFRPLFQGWCDSDQSFFRDPHNAVMLLQQARAALDMGLEGWRYMLASWHAPHFRRHSAGRGKDAGFGPHQACLKFERSVETLRTLYREEQVKRQAAFEANLTTAGHMLYMGEDEVRAATCIRGYADQDWED